MRLVFAAFLVLTACATAPAPATPSAAVSAWVQAHYRNQLREVQVFYGDFTGDGVPDALAWVMYNDAGLHNFGEAALFRSARGRMVFWRLDQTASGEAPRNVVFARGRVTLTTTILQDGDPRCCPTGEENWVLDAR